jgi:REP element-mobilizing transposase RayT
MKRKQLQLFASTPKTHGGEASRGRRKGARPVATKRPMHVILRSSRARGEWNFLRRAHATRVKGIAHSTARRFGVRLHRFENVGNHLHLIVQAKRRADFQNFLRVLAQAVCFLVTKARKGSPIGKFWDALAFSRVVEWGRDYLNLLEYLRKNEWEAGGMPRDRVDHWFGVKRELLRESGPLKST